MLKKLPIQLALCIIIAFFVGNYVTLDVARFFFTLSCTLKDFLMQVLPIVIFSYIAGAILSLQHRAPVLIICLLALVYISNLIAVWASYGVALMTLPFLTEEKVLSLALGQDLVTPLFTLPFEAWLKPDKALMLGLAAGLTLSFFPFPKVIQKVLRLRQGVTIFLNKVFIPLLPIYVFGFVLKIQYEGNLAEVFLNYGQIFIVTCLFIIFYISLMYLSGVAFKFSRFKEVVQSMLPAGLTGFSTMSSAATMPITLAATEENLKDPQFAHLIIPTTVNNHLLGDALGIPLLGLAVLTLSGSPLPGFMAYIFFSLYFAGAKFSTAGVPGGGVLVLLPVLQSHLGLSVEMTALVATIYILQDSIFTACNVMANGAFALLCHRIFKAVGLVKIN